MKKSLSCELKCEKSKQKEIKIEWKLRMNNHLTTSTWSNEYDQKIWTWWKITPTNINYWNMTENVPQLWTLTGEYDQN